MQRFNIRAAVITTLAILVIIAAFLLVFDGDDAQGQTSPAPAPTAEATPTPKPELRNGCKHLFTRKDHAKYTKKVYRRDKITRSAKQRIVKLRRCQKTDKQERAAKRFEKKQREHRQIRATRLCGTPSCNRELGRIMLARTGGDSVQFSCLDELWGNRESGWNQYADNPNSSAYGIPQALPGSKMASHGSDWATNPRTQIAWGLDYIDGRYGSPCGAVGFSNSNGYY